MQDISILGYEAGWMGSLEFELWEIVCGTRSRRYGQVLISDDMVKILAFLAELLGGWMVLVEDAPVFMRLQDWRAWFERRTGRPCPTLPMSA